MTRDDSSENVNVLVNNQYRGEATALRQRSRRRIGGASATRHDTRLKYVSDVLW